MSPRASHFPFLVLSLLIIKIMRLGSVVPNVLWYLSYIVNSVGASSLSLLSLYPPGPAQSLALWGSISVHLAFSDLAVVEINPNFMCIWPDKSRKHCSRYLGGEGAIIKDGISQVKGYGEGLRIVTMETLRWAIFFRSTLRTKLSLASASYLPPQR